MENHTSKGSDLLKLLPFNYTKGESKMDKNSFLIYLDYEEQFNLLTDEQVGQLIRAIMKYEKTKEEPNLDGMLKMAFSFIKTQLDRDREKYEEKCEKNRQNGFRGGRPKKNQMENKKPNGFEENQTKPKKADNDNEDENDNENDKDNEKEIDSSKDNDISKIDKLMIECLNTTNTNNIMECISYLEKIPIDLIEYGLRKTARKQHPSWQYAMTILDDYVRKKYTTIEQVKADELSFKSQSANKGNEKEETKEEKTKRKIKELEELMNANK